MRNRLEEISKGDYGITAHYFMGCQFSYEDLAYIPPEYLSRESDIANAIANAEEKLLFLECEKLDDCTENKMGGMISEEIPGQLTIWDFFMCGSVDQSEEGMKVAA